MQIFRLVLALVLSGVVAYLIGSVNFAIIVTRIFAHEDIRKYGSGNAGMTNVLRTLGKGPAALVTSGDFCKGVLAVLISYLLLRTVGGTEPPFYTNYVVAVMVLLGHCFPVFYGFRGGKGILVSAGVILVLNPLILLALLAIFLVVVIASRIVSLASITVAVAYPILTLIFGLVGQDPYLLWDVLVALCVGGAVVWMHRANIRRLIDGTEHKFGQKKS